MTREIIDITNTDILQCEPTNEDGLVSAPCEPKHYDDVLYVPQLQSWYLVPQSYSDELKNMAQTLDDSVQPLTEKLYLTDVKAEATYDAQLTAMQSLNEKGVLENYKTRSHLFFLESEADKKLYAQSLYVRALLNTFVRQLKNTSKIPRLEIIEDHYNRGITRYASQLGLTHAELTEGSVSQRAISSIERYVTVASSSRIASRGKKGLIRHIQSYVIRPIELRINKLEQQARSSAKKQGFSWYKSKKTQKCRFVKDDDVRIEPLYSSYKKRLDNFLDVYKEDENGTIETEFREFKTKPLINNVIATDKYNTFPSRDRVFTYNMFNTFLKLNLTGIVLPEQALEKQDLFARSEKVEEQLNTLLTGTTQERQNTFIRLGRKILESCSLPELHYDAHNREPVPLNQVCQGDGVTLIEELGYYNILRLTPVWDEDLSAFIRFYVEKILEGTSRAGGYADGGLCFLLALRYQLDYLKHKASFAVEEENLHFYALSSPRFTKNALLPPDDISWSEDDIELTEYPFAWKESNSHIVEFFLMSERNKPRYMLSGQLEKLDTLRKEGRVTQLDLTETSGVPDSDTSDTLKPSENIKKSLSQALSKSQRTTKIKHHSTVTLNATEDESFTKYTSLIQASFTSGGGENLSYTVNAQAEFLRFCTDAQRFKANYPESFGAAAEAISKSNATIASLNAKGNIDLAAGFIKVHQMLPSRNGYPMLLPAIAKGADKETSIHYHLGQLRHDFNSALYGSIGVGFAFASTVNIHSVDAGVLVEPIIPAKTSLYIPTGASIKGEVDIFAGARIGHTQSTTVKWCKPGSTAGSAKNWIAQLDDIQRESLLTTQQYAQKPDEQWNALGRLGVNQALSFGIGIRGTFQFGYANRQFIIKCGGGFTFGKGGRIDYTIAIYPENLLDIVNALTQVLAKEEFRRVELFTEEDNDGTVDGYKVLNALLTLTLITGLDIGQLALMNMTEVFRQEKELLMHQHSDTVANQINDFFEYKSETNHIDQPWFKHLPPETRARLLYTLTNEGEALTEDLFARIKEINQNPHKKITQKKAPPLTDKETEQLRKGIDEEVGRWVAIARLLQVWSEDNKLFNKQLDRQVEETFARFNADGDVMLASEYGNKIMPVIVWERLRQFLWRMQRCEIKDEELLSTLNYSGGYQNKYMDEGESNAIEMVKKIIKDFDWYFSAYPESKYQEITFTLPVTGKEIKYQVYNGMLRDKRQADSEEKRFSWYHLARKEIFPEDYKAASSQLILLFTDIKKWKQELANNIQKEINEKIEALTGIEEATGKVEILNDMQKAANNGDYRELFNKLGELQ